MGGGKLDALESWARSLKKRDVLGMLDFTFGAPGLIAGRRLVELMRRHVEPTRIESLSTVFAPSPRSSAAGTRSG